MLYSMQLFILSVLFIVNHYLRCSHEVHLKESGLQCTFTWSVVLKSIQQERCTRLDLIGFHEHINNLVNVNKSEN